MIMKATSSGDARLTTRSRGRRECRGLDEGAGSNIGACIFRKAMVAADTASFIAGDIHLKINHRRVLAGGFTFNKTCFGLMRMASEIISTSREIVHAKAPWLFAIFISHRRRRASNFSISRRRCRSLSGRAIKIFSPGAEHFHSSDAGRRPLITIIKHRAIAIYSLRRPAILDVHEGDGDFAAHAPIE